MPRVLIVDDSSESRRALAEWLERRGFAPVDTAGTVQRAADLITSTRFDLVLLDLKLPDGNGLELLEALESQPDAEVVVITGHGTIDSAVEAFHGGAIDYLTKPVDLQRMAKVVKRCLRTLELRSQVATLREQLQDMGRFGSMVGASAAIQEVYRLIGRVAPTDSSVFITGETGTGKELVAETVHQLSRRAKRPFVPLNCGAVPAELIESMLFGHEKGSFTGAERRHKGIFEQADGGTLFLDEVTETGLGLQVKLLRVLETGRVTRIGGTEPVEVDVRIVAASNRNVNEAVQEGKLRSDLLYRLNVFPIGVPALRDRLEDVELLARHFLARLNDGQDRPKRFTAPALERLCQHTWPGNVRELKNVVERAYIIAGDEIDLASTPFDDVALPCPASPGSIEVAPGTSLAEAERRLVLATLEHLGGDKKATAKALGISLKTLYNRLNEYRGEGERKPPQPARRGGKRPLSRTAS